MQYIGNPYNRLGYLKKKILARVSIYILHITDGCYYVEISGYYS